MADGAEPNEEASEAAVAYEAADGEAEGDLAESGMAKLPPAPLLPSQPVKVFRLTGLSAEAVRALAPSVAPAPRYSRNTKPPEPSRVDIAPRDERGMYLPGHGPVGVCSKCRMDVPGHMCVWLPMSEECTCLECLQRM